MPISLTVPESYPQSVEARVVSISASVERKVLVVVVQYGRNLADGFVSHREVRYEFTQETSPTFNQVVQAVPEFRDLRNALESYLVSIGRLSGTVS